MFRITYTDEELAKSDPIDTLKKIVNLYTNETTQTPAIIAKRELANQIDRAIKLIK